MQKARWLVLQVQGTSALEGHGLSKDTIESMIKKLTDKLMSVDTD